MYSTRIETLNTIFKTDVRKTKLEIKKCETIGIYFFISKSIDRVREKQVGCGKIAIGTVS